MGYTKRHVAFTGNGYYRSGYTGPWNSYTDAYVNTAEVLISQEHPSWRKQSDGGGPFAMVKTTFEVSPSYANTSRLRGPWVGVYGGRTGDFARPTFTSDSSLKASGTTAIARSLPTNPASQLAVALGELGKDGLPQMIGSQAFKEQVRTAHKAGGEYLNYQFGWLPLVSDLRKFAHAVKRRDEIMHGYLKYSDKQIRRRYLFPIQEGSDETQYGTGYARALSIDHPYTGQGFHQYKKAMWFSGAFKYHVPIPQDGLEKFAFYRAQASKILGLELTPEVVWNLSPWSWAADWFGNTGDVIHNITRLGKDGLVMRYGYLMNYSMSSAEYHCIGTGPPGNSNRLIAGQTSRFKETNEIMQRIRATPYGFGLTFDGLSNTQKAVIAALGLTRAF